MYKPLNSTILTLVPKVPTPDTMKDFRPIACCNVVYKCYSKILTKKLKKVLPSLIGPEQNAFIKGISITDNVILMHELVRGYSRKSCKNRCAIKVDLMKAYDIVNLKFLFAAMEIMGFPKKFINWTENCVTTACLPLNLNGSLVGYFKNQRELRQGDPFSTFLFLITMEVLSMLPTRKIHNREFDYHPKCKELGISLLIFADDLMLYVNWYTEIYATIQTDFGGV